MNKGVDIKTFSDLQIYLKKKSETNQIGLCDRFNALIGRIQKDTVNISIGFSTLKNETIKLIPFLTQEQKLALTEGAARLCNSHKDGKIFPKIQYKDGSSEFISLDQVNAIDHIEIINLVNQMQIQQSLDNIQNILLDFAEITDFKLNCLLRNSHQDRINKSEKVKLDFDSFIKGDLSKDFVISSINNAFPALKSEISNNLQDLEDLCKKINNKKTSWGMRKLIDDEKKIIVYILEGLTQLQCLYKIEMYFEYERNSDSFFLGEIGNDIFKIQNKYTEFLVSNFSEKKLSLLSGLNTLDEDIWMTKFRPGIEKLKNNKKEVLSCQSFVKESIMDLV